MKWRDLGKGIKRIFDYRKTKSNFGNGVAFILRLETKADEQFEVWAPQRLRDKLLEKDYNFVRNEGLAKSTKTGGESITNSSCSQFDLTTSRRSM